MLTFQSPMGRPIEVPGWRGVDSMTAILPSSMLSVSQGLAKGCRRVGESMSVVV